MIYNQTVFESFIYQDENRDPRLEAIAAKVLASERITPEEGLILYSDASLGFLGSLANAVRERKNGKTTYFNRNFHIEPTNICVFTCNFCSYSRMLKEKEEGWELSLDQMLDLVKKYKGQPVTEVHIVGGVHPKMNLDFFIRLLKEIRMLRPDLHIKGFTAVELHYMFRKAKVNIEEGLRLMKSAGLDSLPGGGAEIFDEEIRSKICADKCNADEWLEIHETAHKLGMHSNATMLYGHIEDYSHRIHHMERLRQLQDVTGGFNTFIPLKFRNKGNDMSHVPEVSVVEDLKNYAVSRIYLDNFSHVKAYWPMIGRNTAQLSQAFGVDDLDGTIDDSTKIYSMAGAEDQNPALSTEQLVELIRESGRRPIERDTLYNVIKDYSEELSQ
ncbi:MAG: aminofutalosine synthase MqnE [Bacteroidetes bacterium]|nr:MAG: aminofutalosine synthase MqnE [Bacteroidota bacterium]REK06977.1 MAG: aminofutalosine synthase MqnE [Bacteroidota bacterium]REK33675.1 MAG: aminofutalosine synthase MqnE [Bacteroidota bacterium]REK47248.1 MAG: aminofutalosine synthase MqnE [Bacteroidota bacterium]